MSFIGTRPNIYIYIYTQRANKEVFADQAELDMITSVITYTSSPLYRQERETFEDKSWWKAN